MSTVAVEQGTPTETRSDSASTKAGVFSAAADVFDTAKQRWLKNREVLDVLQRAQSLGLETCREVVTGPRSGQLVLYDRSVVKHFRRDAHGWKKKRDGKTVREDHEKLKIDSIERLTCCYAHSQEIPTFHRRIYWLLPAAGAVDEAASEGEASTNHNKENKAQGASPVSEAAQKSDAKAQVLVHYLDEREISGDAAGCSRVQAPQRGGSLKRARGGEAESKHNSAAAFQGPSAHDVLLAGTVHPAGHAKAPASSPAALPMSGWLQALTQSNTPSASPPSQRVSDVQQETPPAGSEASAMSTPHTAPDGIDLAPPYPGSADAHSKPQVAGCGDQGFHPQAMEPLPCGPMDRLHHLSWQHLAHQVVSSKEEEEDASVEEGLNRAEQGWQALVQHISPHQPGAGLSTPYPQWQNLAEKAQAYGGELHSLYPSWQMLTEKIAFGHSEIAFGHSEDLSMGADGVLLEDGHLLVAREDEMSGMQHHMDLDLPPEIDAHDSIMPSLGFGKADDESGRFGPGCGEPGICGDGAERMVEECMAGAPAAYAWGLPGAEDGFGLELPPSNSPPGPSEAAAAASYTEAPSRHLEDWERLLMNHEHQQVQQSMDLCRAFDALQDHAANSNHLCGQWHSMVDQVKTMSSSEARKAMVVKEEGL